MMGSKNMTLYLDIHDEGSGNESQESLKPLT